ncbi:MAG TPA: zinc-ribbon and DUF3426 domain-containing protein [Candidatus Tumulicola sp.]|nr:zinc-ribbon and DUF3426 domain-containing protein [Candidatus Tumulicola sp.]
MSDLQFTRCPGCATVYRVTGAQLALREGQVRCGHCRAVFDATAHRVDLAPTAPPADGSAHPEVDDELARGRATVTLREASALEAPEREAPERPASSEQAVQTGQAADAEKAADAEQEPAAAEQEPAAAASPVPEASPPEVSTPDDGGPAPTTAEGASSDAPLDIAELEAARAALRPRRHARSGKVFHLIALAVLVVGLVVQSAALFRDDVVARMPQAVGALDALCRALTCRTGPRHDAGALSIEGSDLQADPAHRGLLVLTATLRNRAGRAVAWPDLELTLTDSSDQAVVRRVLTPNDYLAVGTRSPGLAAHSERQVRLFLDASATRQAGYRLYLFYP